MKKRVFKVSNLLLGAVITMMGFGGCKSVNKWTENPTDILVGEVDPKANGAKELREVYGPPPEYKVPEIPKADTVAKPVARRKVRDNIRIVYGPPPTGRRNFVAPHRAEIDTTKVYDVVEQMPCFPGGETAMATWIKQHLQYPDEARRNSIEGRVILTFIVERDGSTTDFKVVRAVHPALDAEAVRLLRTMPRWIPGRQYGVAARVKYTIPVTFRL